MSTLTSFAASVPVTILQNGYARDLEHEADVHAKETLIRAHISPKAFSTVLLKLETTLGGVALSGYLSTHPTMRQRQELFGELTPDEKAKVLTQGDAQPVAILRFPPRYPEDARARGTTGEVMVDFIVDENGVVQNAFALRSTTPEFEENALAAVRGWRFVSGRKSFRPVNTHLQVPVVFTLQD